MQRLLSALRFALSGQYPGTILVDGRKTLRHWVEPEDVVHFVLGGADDVSFQDQEVQFDDRGVATARDTDGLSRGVRVLVVVPYSPEVQVVAMLLQQDGAND